MWATLPLAVRLAAATAAVSLLPHVPAPARTGESLPQGGQSAKRWLRIEIQQDGRTIPVKDHAVLVHRVSQSVLYLVFYAGDLSNETDNDAEQRAHERQRNVLKITMQ